jgi:hypothetical protein
MFIEIKMIHYDAFNSVNILTLLKESGTMIELLCLILLA